MAGYGEASPVLDAAEEESGQKYGFFKLVGALTLAGVATNVISAILERKKR